MSHNVSLRLNLSVLTLLMPKQKKYNSYLPAK